jgi:hypothetical protein
LIATNRIDGRVTASQIAAESYASFLLALQIGLYVARRHQLHGVTDRLQLAGPMMGRRTSLDANETPRQTCEKLQHFRPADTLADHYSAGVIDAVNLEYRLRNIETDRDNLAHGGSPQSGSLQRNRPMAFRCRRVGTVHSITSGHAILP